MTVANTTDECLIIERTFNAPRDEVFEAFSQPQMLERWFGPGDAEVKRCDLEFTEGGSYCIGLQLSADDYREVSGVYEKIEPLSCIQFSWQWTVNDVTGVLMRVTLEFNSTDQNTTRLTLRQTGFDSHEQLEGHDSGWTGAFEKLTALFQ